MIRLQPQVSSAAKNKLKLQWFLIETQTGVYTPSAGIETNVFLDLPLRLEIWGKTLKKKKFSRAKRKSPTQPAPLCGSTLCSARGGERVVHRQLPASRLLLKVLNPDGPAPARLPAVGCCDSTPSLVSFSQEPWLGGCCRSCPEKIGCSSGWSWRAAAAAACEGRCANSVG